MPRSGPVYTLPEAAFIPNTPILSAAVNDDLSDIADALTNSLARNGAGGMTAVLPLDNTGLSYLSDPNTGMRRTAADAQAISCGGTDVIEITTAEVVINAGLDVAGIVKYAGTPILPIGLGPLPWSGTGAPSKWLLCNGQAVLRASYPDLWTFAAFEISIGNTLFTNGDGTTTFTLPDLRGRVPAGKDVGGANRLTAATISPNATTLGGTGGAETETLSQANLPAATLATTITSGQPHIHQLTGLGVVAVNNGSGASQGNLLTTSGGSPVTLTTGNNSATIAASTALGGSGTAHVNVQPTIITNYIIYAGA